MDVLEREELEAKVKIEETKVCKRCGEFKSLSEFRISAVHKKPESSCLTCRKKAFVKTMAIRAKSRSKHKKRMCIRCEKNKPLTKFTNRGRICEDCRILDMRIGSVEESIKEPNVSSAPTIIQVKAGIVAALLEVVSNNNYDFTFKIPKLEIVISTKKEMS